LSNFHIAMHCALTCRAARLLFYSSGMRCQPRVPAVIKALRTTSTISAHSQQACWVFPARKPTNSMWNRAKLTKFTA